MSGIRVSEKHGVNPSVDKCFICGKDYALILFGKLKGDVEAPRSVCSGNVCSECQEHLDNGAVFFIEIDEERTTDENNPWRTGRQAGITHDGVRRVVDPPELAEQIIEKGVVYVPIEAYERFGIPEAEVMEEEDGGQEAPR